MKINIAIHLKRLRKSLGYSTAYVANELSKYGIDLAPNTLYNYENGVSQPNADMFLYLCEIYGVDDFNIFFGEPKTNKQIILKEKELIQAYKSHPEMQQAIDKMLDIKEPKPNKSTAVFHTNSTDDDSAPLALQITTSKN